MSVLEDRYRRLLRWYPVEHRRVHAEEMLGVLLAAAGPEQTRPSARDALDLARGGLGIRLRRAPRTLAHAGWRDAAALLTVLAPLVSVLAPLVVTMIAIPAVIGLSALTVVTALEWLVIRPVTRRAGTAEWDRGLRPPGALGVADE